MRTRILFIALVLLVAACSSDKPAVDIWTAAATGDTAMLQAHMDYGTPVDEREQLGGSTPLIVAGLTGQVEAGRLLIENGADVNAVNNDGSTALITSAFFAHPDFVALLLENDAATDLRNQSGATALAAVADDWSPELEQLYEMLGAALQMELDLERIRQTRPEVAELIRNHSG